MIHLSAAEREIVGLVARYVDSEVRPVVRDLEHEDTYPEKIIEQMKEMGVYGMCIPEPYGEFGVSTPCFVLVTEELARGWMSLAGAFGGHSVVSKLIHQFGTDEQRLRYLPAMATGELRAAMALTEPSGGSDLQAIRTVARCDGDSWVISGSKMWITNARRSGLIAVLCKTDVGAVPAHKGIGILLVEADADFVVSADLSKMGYKGIETCELSFDECRVPRDALLGGVEGHGFSQMMSGLEIGRLQVAARATGVARAAFDDALAYSQERETFGKPIWQHQSVGNYLADMATSIVSARLLLVAAAESYETERRSDLEAGMAKLLASEVAMRAALDALRIHGAYGYSRELDVERYFRDAPLMIVGEGTNEIQRLVITRQLIERGGLPDVF
jgi:alkylation response protein AidB-like acyl-CoA dehydrogenase